MSINPAPSDFPLALDRIDATGRVSVTVDDYVPFTLDTGHVAANPVRTLSVRRDDGKGLFDIRLDTGTGQLVSASLVLFSARISEVRLDLDAVRTLEDGLPVFGVEARLPDDPSPGGADIVRAVCPLQLHRTTGRIELAWSPRRIDAVAHCDGVDFCFAAGDWVGMALTKLDEAELKRIDSAL